MEKGLALCLDSQNPSAEQTHCAGDGRSGEGGDTNHLPCAPGQSRVLPWEGPIWQLSLSHPCRVPRAGAQLPLCLCQGPWDREWPGVQPPWDPFFEGLKLLVNRNWGLWRGVQAGLCCLQPAGSHVGWWPSSCRGHTGAAVWGHVTSRPSAPGKGDRAPGPSGNVSVLRGVGGAQLDTGWDHPRRCCKGESPFGESGWKGNNRFIWEARHDPSSVPGCPCSPGWGHSALLAWGQHKAPLPVRSAMRYVGYSTPASTRLLQARTVTTTRSLRVPTGLGEPWAGWWQVWVMSWKVRPEGQDVQLLAEAPWQV